VGWGGIEKGRWSRTEIEDRKRHHSVWRKRKDKNREGREHRDGWGADKE